MSHIAQTELTMKRKRRASSKSRRQLSRLPLWIVKHVQRYVDVRDMASLLRVCKSLHRDVCEPSNQPLEATFHYGIFLATGRLRDLCTKLTWVDHLPEAPNWPPNITSVHLTNGAGRNYLHQQGNADKRLVVTPTMLPRGIKRLTIDRDVAIMPGALHDVEDIVVTRKGHLTNGGRRYIFPESLQRLVVHGGVTKNIMRERQLQHLSSFEFKSSVVSDGLASTGACAVNGWALPGLTTFVVTPKTNPDYRMSDSVRHVWVKKQADVENVRWPPDMETLSLHSIPTGGVRSASLRKLVLNMQWPDEDLLDRLPPQLSILSIKNTTDNVYVLRHSLPANLSTLKLAGVALEDACLPNVHTLTMDAVSVAPFVKHGVLILPSSVDTLVLKGCDVAAVRGAALHSLGLVRGTVPCVIGVTSLRDVRMIQVKAPTRYLPTFLEELAFIDCGDFEQEIGH